VYCVCVCQFVCPVFALTFESIHLETFILVLGFTFRICRSVLCARVIWVKVTSMGYIFCDDSLN